MKSILAGFGAFLVSAAVLSVGTLTRWSFKRSDMPSSFFVGVPYLLLLLATSAIVAIIIALLVYRFTS